MPLTDSNAEPGFVAPDYVALHAAARPSHLACVDLGSGRRWTYAELHRDVARYARVLAERWSVGAGDRVAVLAKNGGEQLLVHLACSRLGAIYVPLNWRLAAAELRVAVVDGEPRVLLYDREFAAVAPVAAESVPLAPLAGLDAEARDVAGLATVPVDADAPTVILYTSGTSGRPKGVLITGRNAFFTAVNYSTLGHVAPGSTMLCDAPMFHVICLVASIGSVLMQGGTLLLSPGFDPELTLARIADPSLRVTHYFCVPQMAERLRAVPAFAPSKLRGLTALFTGGAPNPPANVRRWLADGIPMVDGYGMTEVGTVLGMPLEPALIDAKAGAAGLVPPTMRMRLVDPQDRDVADGEVGEIWLKGPNVTPGYWRRPDETARAFASGGWFRTGDLARRDADGFVTIVGRRKEMYISGGENVYPAEVEACLAQHPAVAEVAVVGVPDAQWGEVGAAYVVLAEGRTLDESELRAHAEQRIARYKIPRRWVFVGSLPRTSTGKLQKHLLR